jgi:hypothetical protein
VTKQSEIGLMVSWGEYTFAGDKNVKISGECGNNIQELHAPSHSP